MLILIKTFGVVCLLASLLIAVLFGYTIKPGRDDLSDDAYYERKNFALVIFMVVGIIAFVSGLVLVLTG